MRRYGESPDPNRTYRFRPGAYVILPRGGDLLLTYQAEPEAELQLPGGGIDPGESPIAALHREVFEETGWSIAAPRRLGAFRRFTYMPDYDFWAEKLCSVYIARPIRQLSDPTEPHHTAIWTNIELAVDLLAEQGSADFVSRIIT